jgi:uncharacterized protein YjbJ (UPF0337 family)
MNFKSIIANFVEVTPDTSKDAPATSKTPTGIPGLPGGNAPVNFAQPVSASPAYSTTGAVDTNLAPKFAEKIQAAYSSSPLFDVATKFNEGLASLKDVIPDAGTRYRAVMAQLHFTPDNVRAAYQSLVDVIQGQDKHFGEVIDNQRKTDIGSREQTIASIDAQIEAAKAQIQALMQQRDSVNGEIVATKAKLDSAVTTFDSVAKGLITQVQDNLSSINIYFPVLAAKTN